MSGTKIETRVDEKSAEFEKNSRLMIDRLTEIKNEEERIRPRRRRESHRIAAQKGRLTARERIAKLIDPQGEFFELGLYAAYEMYEEWGGAPAAGAITGLARVSGRQVMIIANDATVKAGAFFPMTAKKVIRAQNIAIDNHIPTIYLVDSAGIFLPLQEDVFPDTDDFGPRVSQQRGDERDGHSANRRDHGDVRRRRRLPAGDVRQDFDDRRQRLVSGGTGLVQAAIGQKDLGGRTWAGRRCMREISGTVDFRETDDAACIKTLARAGGQDGASCAARRSITRPPRHRPIPAKKSTASFPRPRQAIRHARNHRADCGSAANLRNIARNTGRR